MINRQRRSGSEEDEQFIQMCFDLARRGAGYVSPNPMVGCVIVKNSKVIGEGWHERFGEVHAEVNAINASRQNVAGATLYVNLEPCSHTGKTSPCVDMIIENKIARVVVGVRDPNPLVNGAGIQKLKKNGIDVAEGVGRSEARELNKFFFKWARKNTPYVTLKLAQTLDGKISDGRSTRSLISSKKSLVYVHVLRSQYDAVLIGSGTFKKDKPALTVRRVKGRNPVRIIVDSKLSGQYTPKFISAKARTIVFTSALSVKRFKARSLLKNGLQLIPTPEKNKYLDLAFVLSVLGEMGITSVLVEGGSAIATSFIEEQLADELLLFIAPKFFGEGVPAFGDMKRRFVNLAEISSEQSGEDVLVKAVFNRY